MIPKYANTNPSTKYPIVSKAKEVPYYAVGLMFGYVYTAMMTPQQKRLKIPLKWNYSAIKYDAYPNKRISDVSLRGWLRRESQYLKRSADIAPISIPTANETMRR